jgi:hypothetical protein
VEGKRSQKAANSPELLTPLCSKLETNTICQMRNAQRNVEHNGLDSRYRLRGSGALAHLYRADKCKIQKHTSGRAGIFDFTFGIWHSINWTPLPLWEGAT